MASLGMISQKALHKNRVEADKIGKGSFHFAWNTDETAEERQRGLTIDICHQQFETEKYIIELIDSPGHRDFIPNMITGVTQADAALLIVDAVTGGFEAGFKDGSQTREHATICRYLGINQFIVAVNKMDTCNYGKMRFDKIVFSLKTFMKEASFGKTDVIFIPISALEGVNLLRDTLSPELKSWYTGPSLIAIIDNLTTPDRLIDGPLRFSVSSVHKGKGRKLTVFGRVESGVLVCPSSLLSLPDQHELEIISINGLNNGSCVVGSQASLVVKLTIDVDIEVGSVFCHPVSPCPLIDTFTTKLVVFSTPQPILLGMKLMMHHLQSIVLVKVVKILSFRGKTGQPVPNPRIITAESQADVVLNSQHPIPIELFRTIKSMGRFILRLKSVTIAAGMVISIP